MNLGFRWAAIFMTFLWLPASQGQTSCSCLDNGVFHDIGDLRQYLHKVAVFGKPDRKTEDQYAQEHHVSSDSIKKEYAGTGELDCGTGLGVANLVVRGDIIVTAAHATQDSKTCETITEASNCKFKVWSHGQLQSIPVQEQLASGFHCPGGPQHHYDDWAIMRLSRKIDDIEPYQISEKMPVDGDKVVAVGWSTDFRKVERKNGKINYNFIKHVADCEAQNVRSDKGTPYLIFSDCDGSYHSSGGGLFSADGHKLIGIHVGSSESKEQALKSLRTGIPVQKPYDEKTWSSVYVPLTGEFKDALTALTK